jgi:hypothetical protein
MTIRKNINIAEKNIGIMIRQNDAMPNVNGPVVSGVN